MVNSLPRVGPIVISEIHYRPSGNADSEFFELMNISPASVSLYDAAKGAAWKISNGIDYTFPTGSPISMAPGERIVLTKNLIRFNAAYTLPPGTRLIEWTADKLSNDGEQLQLVRPAALDGLNVRQYARVDRVSYEALAPWPTAAAGAGSSLSKIVLAEYGNDVANWAATAVNPGAAVPSPGFAAWVSSTGLPVADQAMEADPDGDGRSNLMEYALGSSATGFNAAAPFGLNFTGGNAELSFSLPINRPDMAVTLETSDTLSPGAWYTLPTYPINVVAGTQQRIISVSTLGAKKRFFRMSASVRP